MLSLFRRSCNVVPIAFTDNENITSLCKEFDIDVFPFVETNEFRTPVFRSFLIFVRDRYPVSQIIYINSDILIDPSVFDIIRRLHLSQIKPVIE